ncbi:MAG: nitric oxide synthase oxygenase [Planctomycetota bacterium]
MVATVTHPLRQRLRRLDPAARRAEAEAFIRQFHAENELSDATCRARIREVVRELDRTGHYDHTPAELAFGARVAWRNHARCIGRLYWKSLEVVDCRHVTDPDGIAARVAEHMVAAHGDGRVRSTISVFAPVRGDELPAHIESRQIAQYAGYMLPGGGILGDPIAVEATRAAIELGWRPPDAPGMFDLLPITICDARGRRHLYELPAGTIKEVRIEHPSCARLAELGLRWYTVPCVSAMSMTIGGIEYPCAPFNGFYMASEIASRNFADETRYDLLRPAAEALGIDARGTLWKDRVITELNEAVLHSYRKAGVAIVDHHMASEQFLDFVAKERAAGREISAEWSWIVPPQASAACPVYHLPMRERNLVPNYYASASGDGAELGAKSAAHPAAVSGHHGAGGDVSKCPFAGALGFMARRFAAVARR